MTREEREDAIDIIQSILNKYEEDECSVTEITIGDEDIKAFKMAIKALEQEPCEDTISRKSIKQKLQEHHDFFVNAYGGFSNLPRNDKSRVDEITNCIAMVVNEPPVIPQEPFINKPCVSGGVCKHDKNKVLDKLRAEIEQEIIPRNSDQYDHEAMWQNMGLRMALKVVDKYKAEVEPHESEG